MTIETLKSPNPRNRNSISVIKSKFLSVSSMNTLLAILKVTDARRHTGRRTVPQFSFETPPPPLDSREVQAGSETISFVLEFSSQVCIFFCLFLRPV